MNTELYDGKPANAVDSMEIGHVKCQYRWYVFGRVDGYFLFNTASAPGILGRIFLKWVLGSEWFEVVKNTSEGTPQHAAEQSGGADAPRQS